MLQKAYWLMIDNNQKFYIKNAKTVYKKHWNFFEIIVKINDD